MLGIVSDIIVLIDHNSQHMKKIYLLFSLLFILSFIKIPTTNAQETWDLEKCVRYALENSLDIQSAQIGVQSSEILLKQAKHNRYPNLSLGTNMGWSFGRALDPTTDAFRQTSFFSNGYTLSSGIMLYNGSSINNSIKQSDLNKQASELDVLHTERFIALNVASAYLAILFAEENLENANFALDLSNKQLEQIDKLINAGSRPKNERLDLLAQAAANEQALVAADNSVILAYLDLKQLMNLEPDYELKILKPATTIPIDSDPDQLTFREVYNEALQHRPDLDASGKRLESSELGVKIAKAALLPSLSFGGSIGTNYSDQGKRVAGFQNQTLNARDLFGGDIFIDNQPINFNVESEVPILERNPYFDQLDQNLNYGVGFVLNIPLYSNYSNKANVELAKLDVLSSKNSDEIIRQTVKSEVQLSLTDAKAAKKELEAANRSLEAQEAAFENAEKRFNLGVISIYDYIDAKNLLDTARVSQVIAKYDYLFKMKVLDYRRGRGIQFN